ncbi:MAG: uroporphyrinogen-III synthase [Ferruginibacter sp.]
MQNNISILCTRSLDAQLIKEAAGKGIDIDVLSFIETIPIESVEIQQEIEAALNASATVVFTSMNAVEAVHENIIDENPEWTIYCIGNTTKQLVKKYFPLSEIVGTADSAVELAELIVEESTAEEVIFFCGDQRRDELPNNLRQHGIEVNEIVVYQTIALQHKIEKEYLGILFFSPSAVESFFKKNKLSAKTILFAIGTTTASTIKKYTSNKILVSDQPGKEYLVEKMIEYFT